MKYEVVRSVWLDEEIHYAGEIVTIDNEKLAKQLVERGTIQSSNGERTVDQTSEQKDAAEVARIQAERDKQAALEAEQQAENDRLNAEMEAQRKAQEAAAAAQAAQFAAAPAPAPGQPSQSEISDIANLE